MVTIPVPTQIVDLSTGMVTDKRVTSFALIPPRPGACPVCAMYPAHTADQPHNQQSLYYQYSFYAQNGRWPTWKDAIANCAAEVRLAWESELKRQGHWTEPGNER